MQNRLTQVQLTAPCLILIGQQDDPTYAKTGLGIVQWRRELVGGQLRFPGCTVDLGVPDLTLDEAIAKGIRSLVIGVAPVGGAIPESWWEIVEQAARAGLDIVSGLHIKLNDRPSLVAIAKVSGIRLIESGLHKAHGTNRRRDTDPAFRKRAELKYPLSYVVSGWCVH